MVTIERPCCDQPVDVAFPLPDELRCDDCAVTWTVTDPAPAPTASHALAA